MILYTNDPMTFIQLELDLNVWSVFIYGSSRLVSLNMATPTILASAVPLGDPQNRLQTRVVK